VRAGDLSPRCSQARATFHTGLRGLEQIAIFMGYDKGNATLCSNLYCRCVEGTARHHVCRRCVGCASCIWAGQGKEDHLATQHLGIGPPYGGTCRLALHHLCLPSPSSPWPYLLIYELAIWKLLDPCLAWEICGLGIAPGWGSSAVLAVG
jgi:hypothetical protein